MTKPTASKALKLLPQLFQVTLFNVMYYKKDKYIHMQINIYQKM
jgi:hypothetical protein